ncbi:MAG: hypothetical protein ACYTEX_08300 [Planctomycetota bacterium]|jgi:hypothetical protein
MQPKQPTLCAILIVVLSGPAAAESYNELKVALIADKAFDLHRSPLVSLLEAKLSEEPNVVLLERAEIDRILREQKLSLAGLLQRDTVVRVGRLLRADAFVLLSVADGEAGRRNEKMLLRVRLVETAHGLRLFDCFEKLDTTKPLEAAARITESMLAVGGKLLVPPNEAIPVGIVNIHRVQIGERYGWLARALPKMLSVRLNKEPRMMMLEREDLKVLHDEKLLTEGEDSAFWSSAVLIDGYLQRVRTEAVEIKLRLRRGLGKEIASLTLPVEPNELSTAVEKAAAGIIAEVLNSAPTASWQPKEEAEEFFRQGRLLMTHGRRRNAVVPLETAQALCPENMLYTGAIVENEWRLRYYVGSVGSPGGTGLSYYSDLELAEIVSLLVRQIRREYSKGSIASKQILFRWHWLLSDGHHGYFAKSDSTATDEIRQINRENRRIWTETAEQALTESPDRRPYMPVALAWIRSDVPEGVMANLKKIFTKLMMPPEQGGQVQSSHRRYKLCRGILLHPDHHTAFENLEQSQLRGASKDFQQLYRQYLQDLTNSEDPVVRFISCLRLGGENKDYHYKAAEILQKEFKTPNEPFDDRIKRTIRHDLTCELLYPDNDMTEMVGIMEELYEPLIENKDVENLLLWHPGASFRAHHFGKSFRFLDPPPAREDAKRVYRLLERIAEVLETRTDDIRVVKALTRLRDRLAEFRELLGGSRSDEMLTKVPVTLLFNKKNLPKTQGHIQYMYGDRAILHRDILWIGFQGSVHGSGVAYGVIGIDLKEKKLAALLRAVIGLSAGSNWAYLQVLRGVTVSEDAIYVLVRYLGIIELPGSSTRGRVLLSRPTIFTEKDGLPTVSITSIARVQGKLWLAYGREYGVGQKESGLGVYDPANGRWDTVLCSTLKGEAPFNSGHPYKLSELTFAAPDKLYFCATGLSQSQHNGLWRININTREFKQLSAFTLLVPIADPTHKPWFMYGMVFDPDIERVTVLMSDPEWLDSRLSKEKSPGLQWQRDPFIPDSSAKQIPFGDFVFGELDLESSAIHEGKLWARLGKSQLIILGKGRSFEEARIIENNILDGGKVLRFLSTPHGLVAIGKAVVGLVESGSSS